MSKENYIKHISKKSIKEVITITDATQSPTIKDGKEFYPRKSRKNISVLGKYVSDLYEADLLLKDYGLRGRIGKAYLLGYEDSGIVLTSIHKKVTDIMKEDKKDIGKCLNEYMLHISDIVYKKGITDVDEIVSYVKEKYNINTNLYDGSEMWFIIQMVRKKYEESKGK